jgi:hypothetical protein
MPAGIFFIPGVRGWGGRTKHLWGFIYHPAAPEKFVRRGSFGWGSISAIL